MFKLPFQKKQSVVGTSSVETKPGTAGAAPALTSAVPHAGSAQKCDSVAAVAEGGSASPLTPLRESKGCARTPQTNDGVLGSPPESPASSTETYIVVSETQHNKHGDDDDNVDAKSSYSDVARRGASLPQTNVSQHGARETVSKKTNKCPNCGEDSPKHPWSRCPTVTCFKCGANGHIKRECPTAGKQTNPKGCFNCGQEGHFIADCPTKKKTKREEERCHFCGVAGHWVRECPKKARANATMFESTVPQLKRQLQQNIAFIQEGQEAIKDIVNIPALVKQSAEIVDALDKACAEAEKHSQVIKELEEAMLALHLQKTAAVAASRNTDKLIQELAGTARGADGVQRKVCEMMTVVNTKPAQYQKKRHPSSPSKALPTIAESLAQAEQKAARKAPAPSQKKEAQSPLKKAASSSTSVVAASTAAGQMDAKTAMNSSRATSVVEPDARPPADTVLPTPTRTPSKATRVKRNKREGSTEADEDDETVATTRESRTFLEFDDEDEDAMEVTPAKPAAGTPASADVSSAASTSGSAEPSAKKLARVDRI